MASQVSRCARCWAAERLRRTAPHHRHRAPQAALADPSGQISSVAPRQYFPTGCFDCAAAAAVEHAHAHTRPTQAPCTRPLPVLICCPSFALPAPDRTSSPCSLLTAPCPPSLAGRPHRTARRRQPPHLASNRRQAESSTLCRSLPSAAEPAQSSLSTLTTSRKAALRTAAVPWPLLARCCCAVLCAVCCVLCSVLCAVLRCRPTDLL